MKIFQQLMFATLLVVTLGVIGCGESKPDPREREGFVDTSDPNKVQMGPPSKNQGKSGRP